MSFGDIDSNALAESRAFSPALDELEAAINLDDVLWARELAQWLKRALDWDGARRPEGAVMRAAEITGAQLWVGQKPPSAPDIPEVVSAFITASLAKEEHDRVELNAQLAAHNIHGIQSIADHLCEPLVAHRRLRKFRSRAAKLTLTLDHLVQAAHAHLGDDALRIGKLLIQLSVSSSTSLYSRYCYCPSKAGLSTLL